MRIIAFVLDPPVIERILDHVVDPTTPPAMSAAQAPPQAELGFAQAAGSGEWPEMDQRAGLDNAWA